MIQVPLCYWQNLVSLLRNGALAASLSCPGSQGWLPSPRRRAMAVQASSFISLRRRLSSPSRPRGGLAALLSQTPGSDPGCWRLPWQLWWQPQALPLCCSEARQ